MLNRVGGLLCVLAALTVTGCADPTLDGSSQESFEASRDRIRESLPEGVRQRFDTALMVVAMEGVSLEGILSGNPEDLISERVSAFGGLTAEQVMSRADSIQIARQEEMLQEAQVEIAELEARRDSAEAAQDMISAFEVSRSRLGTETSYGMTDVTLTLDVRNGLEVPVSRAYFVGTYQSPGRSVPWLREEFNYQIPGGLEPGESSTWRLSPNTFMGDWRNAAQADRDAVFTVEVMRLDGPDGQPIGGPSFSDRDAERLESLRESVEEARTTIQAYTARSESF